LGRVLLEVCKTATKLGLMRVGETCAWRGAKDVLLELPGRHRLLSLLTLVSKEVVLRPTAGSSRVAVGPCILARLLKLRLRAPG
jgi:hypothetical protein